MSELEDSPIARFARHILKRPLYPYQIVISNAILQSIERGDGALFTVMMARQMGKNQLSAILEAFLMATRDQGTIVKAAPTFNPQVINSRIRLMAMLNTDYLRKRIWTSYGMIGLAPSTQRHQVKLHVGPKVMLFSAGDDSNVVGATADILLEIDESQDVKPEKFDRDFRPMASTTNATTVLYGTAWSDDTLLAQQIAINQQLEERGGDKRHFAYDWRTLAAINPHYKKFVEGEIERLGEDHPTIVTQYMLQSISGAGYFLNDLQKAMLQGSHEWEERAHSEDEDGVYVAGMDVAGEENRLAPGEVVSSTRDSTVISIGRVTYNAFDLPRVEIVHQIWWTGLPFNIQYEATVELCEMWGIQRLVVDKTGLGAGLASMLELRLGEERVIPFTFSRPSKSKLGYQMLSLINSARLKLYELNSAPRQIAEECVLQLRRARYRLPAPETIDMYVPAEEGHDDFLMSIALLCEAMSGMVRPPTSSAIVRPKRLYGEEESRY